MSETCQRCYKIVEFPCRDDTNTYDCPNLDRPTLDVLRLKGLTRAWLNIARHRKSIGDREGMFDALYTARRAAENLKKQKRREAAEEQQREWRRRDLMETREDYWS